jgi:hypothetical protein
MTLSALGIFSAAGAGGGFSSDYELIETQILGSSQANITFSNLNTYSSTYKHLQIRAVVRSVRTGFAGDNIAMRFNADTAANYSWHLLRGTGSAVDSLASVNATLMLPGWVSASTSPTSAFGAVVIDILDPYATKNKTIRSLTGQTGTDANIRLTSGNWRNTGTITSTNLFPIDGTAWDTGSRFSLYGIKG